MRVLVIGGTRFIGPPVVRWLAARGHAVTVLHRGRSERCAEGALPGGVEHLHVAADGPDDRSYLPAMTAAIRRVAPEVVLDMIPLTERSARTTIAAFRGVARHFVAVSSMDVYRAFDRFRGADPGPPEPVPLTEDSPLRERLYPYREAAPAGLRGGWQADYDKILVERVVLGDPGLAGTVVRLPVVYGPGDYQRRLFPYLRRMDDRRPAILLEERMAGWRGARGYVENVAVAIGLAVEAGSGGRPAAGRVYHVADPEPLTEAEWVGAIGRAAGWDGRIVTLPADRMPEGLRSGVCPEHHLAADTRRVREELGYAEVVPLEEALRRTVDWERGAGVPDGAPRFDYAAEDAALS